MQRDMKADNPPRRVSRGLSRRLRVHWRAQVRHSQSLVHLGDKLCHRLWLCRRRPRTYDCCARDGRRASPCRLAHNARDRLHTSIVAVLHAIQAARARSVPAKQHEQGEDAVESDFQVVLEAYYRCIDHLVHLRLLFICFWHLLCPERAVRPWRECSSLEDIRVGTDFSYSLSNIRLTYLSRWNTVLNVFYLPGAFLGSYVSDWVGPRRTLAYGVAAQAIVGFLMAGLYPILAHPKNIGGFCVLYGVFLSLGELGPGDNIGLVASKTCATPFRGKYYAFAAAFGKIGAFIGNYLYPILVADAGSDTVKGNQYPVSLIG